MNIIAVVRPTKTSVLVRSFASPLAEEGEQRLLGVLVLVVVAVQMQVIDDERRDIVLCAGFKGLAVTEEILDPPQRGILAEAKPW